MNYLEILLIAMGLAMDCFAVSFSAGASQPKLRFKNALLIALFFGFFQATMPVIGWLGGEFIVEKISHFDHWIAFVILTFVGGKMIYEAFTGNAEDTKERKIDITKLSTLFILSLATSIDALAVGFSFAMVNVQGIGFVIFMIGIVSFSFTLLGIYGGKKLCHIIRPSYAELLGGVILIIIGTKILIEHLLAA